jgi:hypothetical protein
MSLDIRNPSFHINSFKVTTDTILFYYEVPLFCLCKTARDIYYLAYCYEDLTEAWILAQVSRTTLIDMFQNKIAMSDVFQNAKEKWIGTEDKLMQKVESFDKSELPKKDAMYGKISDLEIGLIKRLETETIAINQHKVRFTKKQLLDAIKELSDDDTVQVQINFSCDAVSPIDPNIYKGTTECQRITGVEVDSYINGSTGKTSRVANLNIDVEID